MKPKVSNSSVCSDRVFQFVSAAFRQDRLGDDLEAVFKWVSELPENLDLLSQRAFLVLARKAMVEAIVEARHNDEKLSGQVPKILKFLEERSSRGLDDLVDRLTEKFQPLMSQPAAAPAPVHYPDWFQGAARGWHVRTAPCRYAPSRTTAGVSRSCHDPACAAP